MSYDAIGTNKAKSMPNYFIGFKYYLQIFNKAVFTFITFILK